MTTVQCYLSAVMAGRKHGLYCPPWVKYLIDVSVFWEFIGPNRKPLPWPHSSSKPSSQSPSSTADDGVQMRTKSTSGDELGEEVYGPLSDAASIAAKGLSGSFQQATSMREDAEVLGSKERYSWERGSRAFDRIARIVLPTVFVLFAAVWLSDKLK